MSEMISAEARKRYRERFPALSGETIYLENAGGSQVPKTVVDAMYRYMTESYVQLGAGYSLSRGSSELVATAHDFVKLFMGGEKGEVILGASSSALLQMLADCYKLVLSPGQEIVVARIGHEANIGPWIRMESQGIGVRWWEMDISSVSSPMERLEAVLSDKTALVAFPHVSNLLGEILDVELATKMAHSVGARVVVDGVAFAPHRTMNVSDWNVDWYAYSAYKVYGPHMAALWGAPDAISELRGPNHFFVDEVPYQFELGGACHEGCAGILGLTEYLALLASSGGDELNRDDIERAGEVMTACELPLQERLIDYLLSRSDLRIVGPRHADPSRVGTISFVHDRLSSRSITEVVDRSEIAIRHGHMYAYHLCEALGLDPEDGVVRISLVHYNTEAEIERLIEVLDQAMA